LNKVLNLLKMTFFNPPPPPPHTHTLRMFIRISSIN
jgi:hypothetical protein